MLSPHGTIFIILILSLAWNCAVGSIVIDKFIGNIASDELAHVTVTIPRSSRTVRLSIWSNNVDNPPWVYLRYDGIPTLHHYDAAYQLPASPELMELTDRSPSESILYIAIFGGSLLHSQRYFTGTPSLTLFGVETEIESCDSDLEKGPTCEMMSLLPVPVMSPSTSPTSTSTSSSSSTSFSISSSTSSSTSPFFSSSFSSSSSSESTRNPTSSHLSPIEVGSGVNVGLAVPSGLQSTKLDIYFDETSGIDSFCRVYLANLNTAFSDIKAMNFTAVLYFSHADEGDDVATRSTSINLAQICGQPDDNITNILHRLPLLQLSATFPLSGLWKLHVRLDWPHAHDKENMKATDDDNSISKESRHEKDRKITHMNDRRSDVARILKSNWVVNTKQAMSNNIELGKQNKYQSHQGMGHTTKVLRSLKQTSQSSSSFSSYPDDKDPTSSSSSVFSTTSDASLSSSSSSSTSNIVLPPLLLSVRTSFSVCPSGFTGLTTKYKVYSQYSEIGNPLILGNGTDIVDCMTPVIPMTSSRSTSSLERGHLTLVGDVGYLQKYWKSTTLVAKPVNVRNSSTSTSSSSSSSAAEGSSDGSTSSNVIYKIGSSYKPATDYTNSDSNTNSNSDANTKSGHKQSDFEEDTIYSPYATYSADLHHGSGHYAPIGGGLQVQLRVRPILTSGIPLSEISDAIKRAEEMIRQLHFLVSLRCGALPAEPPSSAVWSLFDMMNAGVKDSKIDDNKANDNDNANANANANDNDNGNKYDHPIILTSETVPSNALDLSSRDGATVITLSRSFPTSHATSSFYSPFRSHNNKGSSSASTNANANANIGSGSGGADIDNPSDYFNTGSDDITNVQQDDDYSNGNGQVAGPGLLFVWSIPKPRLPHLVTGLLYSRVGLAREKLPFTLFGDAAERVDDRRTEQQPQQQQQQQREQQQNVGETGKSVIGALEVQLTLLFLPCPTGSCQHGTCQTQDGDISTSTCVCSFPWAGESCDQLSMPLWQYWMQIASLVLSNLAAIPACLECLRRNMTAVATTLSISAAASALYHLCDSDVWCVASLSFTSLHTLDVLFSLLSLCSVALYHGPFRSDCHAALVILTAGLLVSPISNDPTNAWTIAAAIIVSLFISISGWLAIKYNIFTQSCLMNEGEWGVTRRWEHGKGGGGGRGACGRGCMWGICCGCCCGRGDRQSLLSLSGGMSSNRAYSVLKGKKEERGGGFIGGKGKGKEKGREEGREGGREVKGRGDSTQRGGDNEALSTRGNIEMTSREGALEEEEEEIDSITELPQGWSPAETAQSSPPPSIASSRTSLCPSLSLSQSQGVSSYLCCLCLCMLQVMKEVWIMITVCWKSLIGVGLSLIGLALFVNQTHLNYWYVHSLWHACIMFAAFPLIRYRDVVVDHITARLGI